MKIICSNCRKSLKLSIFFWGYKVKCTDCGFKIDFNNHKILSKILPLYNFISIVLLLACGTWGRPYLQDELKLSYLMSLLLTFLILILCIAIIIIPIYHLLIYCFLK